VSVVYETKLALFEALKLAVPPATQCTFAQTGKADRRNQVWLGATGDDDLQVVGFRSGTKKPTNISGYVDVHAVCISPGNPADAERNLAVLRAAIVEAVASVDRSSVPGLLDLRAESGEVDTSETTDGAFSELVLRVRVRGRVTQ
jgi:hypothetical protein